MEVKVYVDGFPRVVCGVTDNTTCQEVVIALAQFLGQPGRYILREKFKGFERSLAPNEHILESLKRYGEQAREVQLTLFHNTPYHHLDGGSKAKGSRYQPGPQLRKKEAGARTRRGSGLQTLHRQSLPPLSRLHQEDGEQPPEDVKRPKRKSLTLMEEAWGWLENLGKGRAQYSTCDSSSSKNCSSLDVSVTVHSGTSASSTLQRKGKGKKIGQSLSDVDQQISCCMRNQHRDKERKHSEESAAGTAMMKAEDPSRSSSSNEIEEKKNKLRETIRQQHSCLQELQVQIKMTDKRIRELEEKQRARKAEEDARQKVIEEETEQLLFWENELKAEEGYGNDLQVQFMEMRGKAVECKARLEEYKSKMQGFEFSRVQNVVPERPDMTTRRSSASTATESLTAANKVLNQQRSHLAGDVTIDRKFPPRDDLSLPHALVQPSVMKPRRPTGPTELREWWTRWAEAQSPHSEAKCKTKPKVIHRSELTIYLSTHDV